MSIFRRLKDKIFGARSPAEEFTDEEVNQLFDSLEDHQGDLEEVEIPDEDLQGMKQL